MAVEREIERILQLYPDDCQAMSVRPYCAPTSFSGARLWRVTAPRGELCLRRWPREHPGAERLQFVQAVLWHVDQEGFHRVPLPLETRHRHGFVWHAGHLWELVPWLPGNADYRAHPSPARLQAALQTLAEFHEAARTFPLPDPGPGHSPGMERRTDQLEQLLRGKLDELSDAVLQGPWPELRSRGQRLLKLARETAPRLWSPLAKARQLSVALEPCIRDVWHAHVLFTGDRVTGLVDFGAMRPDNVATDIARLLGSLAGDDAEQWQRGLAAYQTVRRLSDDELELVEAFDRSTVLMGGLQWLEWVYIEGRTFGNPAAVLERCDEFVDRLTRLTQAVA
jgi:Ser/Thr protein kinase RdoA (MazF antagonist)